MEYIDMCDKIWLFSKYYGDMVATAIRLKENDESYASLMILFNSMELIFKAIRGNDSHNFNVDVEWLFKKGLLSKQEFDFIESENNGIRSLRNKMTHKDFYKYGIEKDDILYSFADKETWDVMCDYLFKPSSTIIYNAVLRIDNE